MGESAETVARREAMRELLTFHTHDALTKEKAEEICFPFGVKAPVYGEKVNTDPKGLWVEGEKKGETVYTAAVFNIAPAIARKLGVSYEGAMGRGTEFWRAIDAIKAKFPDYFTTARFEG